MRIDDQVSNLQRQTAELTRAIAGLPVRWGSGGSNEFFQIIRGTTVGANLDTDDAFTIENIVALEDHSVLPDSPLWIANIPLVAHAMGDTVYALYRSGISVTATGAPATVDWEAFAGSASSTPPLREFILAADKARGDGTASVYWLTEAGVLVGDPVDIDDATLGSRYAGKTASYIEGEEGFEGQAIQMRDLSETPSPDTWRIINMEAFAEFIYVTWYSAGVGHYVSNESADDPWNRREPAVVGGDITLADPAALLGASPATGEKLICRLRDPDTSPPTYDVVGLAGGATIDKAVATASGTITARSGSTPGSGSVTLIHSDGSPGTSSWKNYSTVSIITGTYLVGMRIGTEMVIIDAFC